MASKQTKQELLRWFGGSRQHSLRFPHNVPRVVAPGIRITKSSVALVSSLATVTSFRCKQRAFQPKLQNLLVESSHKLDSFIAFGAVDEDLYVGPIVRSVVLSVTVCRYAKSACRHSRNGFA